VTLKPIAYNDDLVALYERAGSSSVGRRGIVPGFVARLVNGVGANRTAKVRAFGPRSLERRGDGTRCRPVERAPMRTKGSAALRTARHR
jgi:hypothetical protein